MEFEVKYGAWKCEPGEGAVLDPAGEPGWCASPVGLDAWCGPCPTEAAALREAIERFTPEGLADWLAEEAKGADPEPFACFDNWPVVL